MSDPVFVLGMHRCGTSLVSGLLRTLGVEFGPDSDLMAANAHNSKGFFEHVGLNAINVEIMVKFGGEWYAPPVLPSGWENLGTLEDIRKRAAERIESTFGKASIWGFKDPRTCITFPFWKKVVKDPIRVVIVGRNPLSSSRSLQEAQKVLVSEAMDLWFKHMTAAFLGSHGLSRHVVFYEDFLKDHRGELGRLASFVGIPLSDQVLSKADQFMDRHLNHQESSDDEVRASQAVPAKTKRAYLAIRAFVDVAKTGHLEPQDHDLIEQALDKLRS